MANQVKFMRLMLAALLIPLSLIGLTIVAVAGVFLTIPDVLQMKGCMTTTMYGVRLCPGEGDYARYEEISANLVNAVVASEDASFFHHGGFDWYEVKESLTANLRQHGYKRGASTITQQLAKNVFLGQEKSILRKLREAILTLDIERHFTKTQILEKYLNVVEFGPGVYGARSAAHFYFKKTPHDLNVLEASYLAFLLPNPKSYSKSFGQGALTPFARKIMTVILRRLAGFGSISQETLGKALAKLNEFPWQQISPSEFGSAAPSIEASSTTDIIEKFLNDESPVDAISEQPEPAVVNDPDDQSGSRGAAIDDGIGDAEGGEATEKKSDTWD